MLTFVDVEKWIPIVGRFIIAFGSMESSINCILQLWCSPQEWSDVAHKELAPRVNFLRSKLDQQSISRQAKRVLRQNLDDVMHLAKTRNLIAHNPLILSLFEGDDGDSVFQEAIFSIRDEHKYVTLDDLLGLLAQAEALEDAMAQNAASIKLHGKIIPGVPGGPYQPELKRPGQD
jgi:hypothetical protein